MDNWICFNLVNIYVVWLLSANKGYLFIRHQSCLRTVNRNEKTKGMKQGSFLVFAKWISFNNVGNQHLQTAQTLSVPSCDFRIGSALNMSAVDIKFQD